MEKTSYVIKSLVLAAATFLYIAGIVFLISNGEKIFGPKETLIIPIFMLLLLVVSATITGLLVFGKPIMLYLDNRKKEAFTLLFGTIGWLAIFLLLITIGMILL